MTEMITGDCLRLEVCLPRRLNLLLTGPDAVTERFVKTLRPHLQDPVVVLRRGTPFALPSAAVGTLLLAEVGVLTFEEQVRLYEWLGEESRSTQVISTTTADLLPMIAEGSFLEELYYRLNTIYVDVMALPSE
jgi:sigma54-dependent transcription regulator